MNDSRSPEQTREEIAKLSEEIITLEHKMEVTHDESGSNSPDDNSQEATTDYIGRATIGATIEEKRLRMVQLEEELARSEAQ